MLHGPRLPWNTPNQANLRWNSQVAGIEADTTKGAALLNVAYLKSELPLCSLKNAGLGPALTGFGGGPGSGPYVLALGRGDEPQPALAGMLVAHAGCGVLIHPPYTQGQPGNPRGWRAIPMSNSAPHASAFPWIDTTPVTGCDLQLRQCQDPRAEMSPCRPKPDLHMQAFFFGNTSEQRGTILRIVATGQSSPHAAQLVA